PHGAIRTHALALPRVSFARGHAEPSWCQADLDAGRGHESNDPEQDDRSDNGRDQAPHELPRDNTKAGGEHPSARQRANDSDHNISEHPVPVPAYHAPSQRSSDEDKPKDIHRPCLDTTRRARYRWSTCSRGGDGVTETSSHP